MRVWTVNGSIILPDEKLELSFLGYFLSNIVDVMFNNIPLRDAIV